MSSTAQFHGSDLEAVAQHYGVPEGEIVSFGANVNPLGLSPMLRTALAESIDAVMRYPERDYAKLRAALGRYCGAPPQHILVGSGATEIISLFIQSIAPRRAMLVEPTYSEYAREIALAGGELVPHLLRREREFRLDADALCAALDGSFDLLILCNPNNPTGGAVERADLRKILSHCRARGIRVMVDETYVEFAWSMEEITAVPLAEEFDNLLVLRGVAKFFAAPGLRLGYAVAGGGEIRAAVGGAQNPWTLNALAATAGCSMFEDRAYIDKTRAFVHDEMARLCAILRGEKGLHVYPPAANFVLLRILKEGLTSGMVFEQAIRQGLLLRDCASFPGLGENHIRFCLNLPEENDRLLTALRAML